MSAAGPRLECVQFRMGNRIASLALVAASLSLLVGCSQTPWESQFKRGEAIASPLDTTTQVKLREVPWERVQKTLTEIQDKLAKSDTHIDDWTPAEKTRLRGELLRGLQISTPPQDVEVLGRSEFRTTSGIRPGDGSLEAFARKLGATTVVYTTAYLGKAEAVRQEAVQSYRTGSHYYDRNGKHRDSVLSESSIYWVPVTVQADENGYIAFFLRER